MSELTVILPTLNEAGNLRRLVSGIWSSVPDADIIVVDDGSTDGTPAVAAELMAESPRLRLRARTGRPCLKASIAEGIAAAATPYVAWMDADLSHPPELLPELLSGARASGCAVATRYAGGGDAGRGLPRSHADLVLVLSRYLSSRTRAWLHLPVTDCTSGFIVCRRDLIADHELVGDYGEYFIELMWFLSRRSIDIVDVPFVSPPRTWGESKTGASLPLIFKRGSRYLWLALTLRILARLDEP